MEHSTIGLIIFIVATVLMAVVYIYLICRDFCDNGTSLNRLHYSPPVPPPAKWNTRTETKQEHEGPWYLVVYKDVEGRNYTAIAAEDVAHIQFSCAKGDLWVYSKVDIGYANNKFEFTGIDHYEFLRASQLGDYRDFE